MKTPVSELLRILSQTPASYPVIIVQEGVEHEIELIEFGHNPPNLTIKLKPIGDVRTHIIGQLTAVLHSAGAPEFANGERAAEWAAEVKRRMEMHLPAPLPEPEATIAEIQAIPEIPEVALDPDISATLADSDVPEAEQPVFEQHVLQEPMTPQDVELSAANYKMQAPEPVAPVVKPKKASTKKAKTS